jgi:hypothetical protein
MLDWLSQQSPGQLTGLVAVVMGPLIAIVAIVSASWARVRRNELQAHIAEMEAALKQQMIERGMSADEIERVLAAGQSNKGTKKKNVEDPVAQP